MADRSILFSAAMVRAILDGRKTQTRRIFVPPLPYDADDDISVPIALGEIAPRIKRGDRLYVREAWRTEARYDDRKPSELPRSAPIYYEADGKEPGCAGRLRASMFLPRWGSRITLLVTDVRIERLQDISDEDAIAEGVERETDDAWADYLMPSTQCCLSASGSYRTLWDHINGKGAWESNPWVAAYSFQPIFKNIDEVDRA